MGRTEIQTEVSNKWSVENLVKYFLLTVNVIFEITGAVLIGFGIRSVVTVQRSGLNVMALPTIFIITGCIIIILSSIGYSGTKKEDLDRLRGYAWFLVVILSIKIICIIIAITVGNHAFGVPDVASYKEAFNQYGIRNKSTVLVDKIQKSLFCCGFDVVEAMADENKIYPKSCCLNLNIVECKDPFFRRCKVEIARVIIPMSTIAKFVYYPLVVLEVLCIVASCYFISIVRKKKLKQIVEQQHEYSDLRASFSY